jgi:hypothetical protein
MKRLPEFVLLLVLGGGLMVGQDQCANCKCTEYPVPKECEKCCGVITGKVSESSTTQVKVTAAGGESHELTVTHKTVISGKFEPGDQVTVVYRRSTNEAGLIRGQ